jgi:hypothetical protein
MEALPWHAQRQAARPRARTPATGGSLRVPPLHTAAAPQHCRHGGSAPHRSSSNALRAARRVRTAASPGAAAAVEDGSALEAAAAEFAAWYAARARDMPAELAPRRAAGPAG